MWAYILMITISVIFAILENNEDDKVKKNVYRICIIVPFFLISGLRYKVGTDYMFRYVPNYLTILHGGNVESLEILFKILIKVSILLNSDYATLFILSSAIIIGLFFISIFKNSKNIIISTIIFFVGSFFFESMNLVRQFIAMSILFLSYKCLFKKEKKICWLMSILVASLIHTMSIVFLITILLDRKIIKFKVLLVLIVMLLLFANPIMDFAAKMTSMVNNTNIAKYANYIKRDGDLPLSGIIVETIIYMYIYIMYTNLLRNKREIERETIFFVNMQSMTLIFTVLNINLDLFFRIALFFSMFQILSIPYVYEKNKECEWKVFDFKIKNRINQNIIKKWNLIFCICLIVLLNSRMVFSNIIKGADEILPYQTIFSREEKK